MRWRSSRPSGMATSRFHLAGHDWGGSIAWALADRYPERIASLTILSRPHPNAFNRALQTPDGDQAHRSRHHRAFLETAPRTSCSPTTPNGCANAGPPRAYRERRWRSISPCSATRPRWRPHLPGIAPAARSAAARPDPCADALYLGRCRRHGGPRRRRRHGRFRRRTLSLRGAARRGTFRRRSGARTRQRIDAGAHHRASGLGDAHAAFAISIPAPRSSPT